MKQTKLIITTVIFLMFYQLNYGQKLSRQVAAFVAVQDSIVALKNVIIIKLKLKNTMNFMR